MSKTDKRKTPTTSQLRRADLSKVKLGRYPFRAGIKYYLAKREALISGDTPREHERKLRQFAQIFEDLQTEGKVSTTDPRHITKEDIEEFVIRIRNVCVTTQETYLRVLRAYLIVFGNKSVDKLRDENKNCLPRSTEKKAIRVISGEDLKKIFDTADNMIGPGATMIRGYIALALGTGARPNEILSAKIDNLNLKKGIFYVRVPKGHGKWSDPKETPIIQRQMIPYLERFLKEREGLLAGARIESDNLFPNIRDGGTPYTGQGIRQQKAKIEKISGVEFQLKDFRSTLASYLFNNGVPLGVVADILRNTNKTAERYYIGTNLQKYVEDAELISEDVSIFQ